MGADFENKMEIDQVWANLKAFYGLDEEENNYFRADLKPETVEFLLRENLHVQVLEFLQSEVEKRLRNNVAPAFWKHFKASKIEENEDEAQKFQNAVNELSVATSAVQPMVTKMDFLAQKCNVKVDEFGQKSYQELFWLFLKGTLHSQLPNSDYRGPIKAFYERAFHVFHVRKEVGNNPNSSMEQDEDDEEGNLQCEGCKKDLPDRCMCNSIMATFHDVNKKLMDLKLLERLTGDIVTGNIS